MKTKRTYIMLYSALLFLLFVGCTKADSEAYDVAINNGLEAIRTEHYDEAETYFKQALEEESEDERAGILLKQTQTYMEAVHFFEMEEYEQASKKAKSTQSLENGSDYLAFKAGELLDDIKTVQEKQDEPVATEETISPKRTFDDFKGTYATFARGHYEWPLDYVFILGENFLINGYGQTGLLVSETLNKMVDGDTLHLHTYASEGWNAGEQHFQIELAYDNQNVRQLQLDSGEILYPVTVADMLATEFGYIGEMTAMMDDVRAYDSDVPHALKFTNTEVLNDYTTEQIEYARVWLNVVGNEEIYELNINHIKAGEMINHYDDNSPVYPEDVTVLTGGYTADGMVIYGSNGDGTINVYPVPSHWHAPDEDLPAIYDAILNPATVYVDPLLDADLLRLMQMTQYR